MGQAASKGTMAEAQETADESTSDAVITTTAMAAVGKSAASASAAPITPLATATATGGTETSTTAIIAAGAPKKARSQKKKRVLRPVTEDEMEDVRKRIKSANQRRTGAAVPMTQRTPPTQLPAWEGPSFAALGNGDAALGEGGYGSVEVGTILRGGTQRRIAVKLVASSTGTPAGSSDTSSGQLADALSDASRELCLLQENRCKFLMSAIGGGGVLMEQDDSASDEDGPNVTISRVGVAILMDEMTGGDLGSRILDSGSLPDEHAKFYAASILLGLEDLHSRSILHRDIKAENILIDADGYVKICDFGLSKRCDSIEHASLHGVVGTLDYWAPEIVEAPEGQEWTCAQCSKALDLWCVGVLVYYCLRGRLPFTPAQHTEHDRDEDEICHAVKLYCSQIQAGIFNPLAWSRTELRAPATSSIAAGRNFVESLLKPEPSERLGMESQGGYAALRKHPWFDKFDWGSLAAGRRPAPWIPTGSHSHRRMPRCSRSVSPSPTVSLQHKLESVAVPAGIGVEE